MRRTVLVVPDLVGVTGSDSPLRQTLPWMRTMAEGSLLLKVSDSPPIETPEALILGFTPAEGQLRQGPLTVSALGADPPEKSAHFHLSWLTAEDGVVQDSGLAATTEEVRIMLEMAVKLNTKVLTLVPGEGKDHGLVCEAPLDMGTTSAHNAIGKAIRDVRPDGDGESMLRRYIDDSINLLSGIPFNLERLDQGLPPLNLLWPWGHGLRFPVPNLALKRGEPAVVESPSMRMQGLARLAGYRHLDRNGFGRGLQTRLAKIAQRTLTRDLSIIWIPALSEFIATGAQETEEERHWFVREMDKELMAPLIQDARLNRNKVFLIAPNSGPDFGLALEFDGNEPKQNSLPFDERAREESVVRTTTLWESVNRGVSR